MERTRISAFVAVVGFCVVSGFVAPGVWDGPGTAQAVVDTCPDDPGKTEPGMCGCGVSDVDTDADGVPDCLDCDPYDPSNSTGGCGCITPYAGTMATLADECACMGELTGDGWVSPADVSAIVSLLLPYRSHIFWGPPPVPPCADMNGDGWASPSDVSAVVTILLPHASNAYWLRCPQPDPEMSYEIGGCASNMAMTGGGAEGSGFSITVERGYIYFEDVIYANCCPEKLCLREEIEGNHITISEIACGGDCDCMCYFPVSATLGPFDPGTYTVEVVEVCTTGLRHTVEVIIGQPHHGGTAYQITECDPDAGQTATVMSGALRFSATVEGRFVHFSDMMRANCCPDELTLDVQTHDNVIAIHETEHTSSPCRCICDFPVSAILGPFEPGEYMLEVYEAAGGFIGSTTIAIPGN